MSVPKAKSHQPARSTFVAKHVLPKPGQCFWDCISRRVFKLTKLVNIISSQVMGMTEDDMVAWAIAQSQEEHEELLGQYQDRLARRLYI